MKCPKCQFENREGAKFCLECGEKLELDCHQCGKTFPISAKFCDACGQRLGEVAKAETVVLEAEGERKHVTALFSDLSGYTVMTESLDPEEVKEITSRIFSQIAQVIAKYEGFVEKFVGDAVMALFGVPKAHEDDPIRAIRAAREIHELVDAISPEIKKRIGQSISMHTGINTGLAVTGEVNMEKGTHGVAGDAINLASRLSGLADTGQIFVGSDTYRQAEGHFIFESLEPTMVKGKEEPVRVYKVVSQKKRPVTIHRFSGLRAELIGRKAEIAQLNEALENLQNGKGRIFSICGDAGTGKSRLVEEFKATLDLDKVQWLEGHAYAYSQNIPYFPLIDLLNRTLQIEEGDPPRKVREKVASEVEDLLGKTDDIVPYVGSLYALDYPEIEDVSPEFWKSRLHNAIHSILSALARKAPTIFCLEDLQWADSSFIELLRHCMIEIRQPAIVLCVYRPSFSLFTSHQLRGIGKIYQEIRLQDLSPSETQDMLESLLKTETIPSDLRNVVQEKAEGNPFYLEELVNSLIESETLVRENGNWRVTRHISELEISTTIQGVISGRFDRLEKGSKRILQEASVIGRAFLYEILNRITELKEDIDRCLRGLEQLDLIRARSVQPDLEYVFKHALTQEVVYNGLLKKERRAIHERIANVMEQLFHERLSEFFETLAFHFKQGQSVHKAVDYLMKSGEKSLKRYAVEESHQYYGEAFDLLTSKPDMTKEEERLLVDLLIKWALVFYYRGGFRDLVNLFSAHVALAESLDDKARLGMFYAWLGFAFYGRGRCKESYRYLTRALELGQQTNSQEVTGYAYAWLSWTCADLGLLEEAIDFGEKGYGISKGIESDPYLYFKSHGALGYAYYHKGEVKKALEAGRTIVEYGQRHSNMRSQLMGYIIIAFSYLLDGDFSSAIESCHIAIRNSSDPLYSQVPLMPLAMGCVFNGQLGEAEKAAQEIVSYSHKVGLGTIGTPARMILGVVSIAKGDMNQGLNMLQEAKQTFLENQRKAYYAQAELIIGNLYLQMVERAGPRSLSTIVKNIGFLIRNAPFAGKKAEDHLSKAIEVAKEIGAKGTLGKAYLDLGLLYKAKRRNDRARECISQAIQIFEENEVEANLKKAKEALISFG